MEKNAYSGVILSIASYFKKIGLSKFASGTVKLLIEPSFFSTRNNTELSLEGRPIQDIKKDAPQKGWFKPTDSTTEKAIASYYKNVLFKKIEEKNNGDFSEFYKALSLGFENLIEQENHPDFPTRLKGKIDLCKYMYNYLKDLEGTCKREQYQDILFSETLYSVLFFLGNGKIYDAISSRIFHLKNDEKDFIEKVLIPYGVNSLPGNYALLSLADQGNVYALYELYSINYYANGDYAKAYEYCTKAALNEEYINPTALWDLAYIFYYYKNQKFPSNELFNAEIPAIDNDPDLRTIDARKIRALKFAKKSYDCGCIAAANLLGNIVSDDEFSNEFKKLVLKDEEKTAFEYYTEAAKSDYVYAHNNLFAYYQELASKEQNDEKKNELIFLGYQHLKASAKLYEPWSCNKYALYLFNKGKQEKSHKYFLRGFKTHHKWCAFNLLEKFYLPAHIGEHSFDYLDNTIDIRLLIKTCLSSTPEIEQKTKVLLLEKAPKLLP